MGCLCPKIYKPVCANGKTYSNSCLAKCYGANMKTLKQGACKKKPCPFKKTLVGCKNVRRAPYFKQVKEIKYKTIQIKYIKKTKVAYKVQVCRTKTIRIKYKKAFKQRKKLKYKKKKLKKVAKYRTHVYYVRQRKTRKLKRKKYYTVINTKNIKIPYKVKKFRKVTKKYTAICKKTIKKKFSKKVLVPYKQFARNKVLRPKKVKRKVWGTKIIKVKYWTGKYTKRGSPPCYRKVYAYRQKVIRVKVTKLVLIKVKVTIKISCIKRKYVTKHYLKPVIVKYKCTKKRIVMVPYLVTKYRIKVLKIKVIKFKWVPYTQVYYVLVRKTKKIKYHVNVVILVDAYRFYWSYGYKIKYRTEQRAYTISVTRYRFIYKLAYKPKTKKYVTLKKVPVKYYTKKCTYKMKRKC